VDIEGSTSRTNPTKGKLRQAMYGLVRQALRDSGIAGRHCDPLVDRGDGLLILIRPVDQIPKTLLITTFVPALGELLAEHNAHRPDHRFRLRAGLHAGEVHYDDRAPFGEAIDLTCRLTDAPAVKATLAQTTAPLVLVVSDDIYRSIIRHRYDRIDEQAFQPHVTTELAGHPQHGWIHIPSAASTI
jgi:hypothetical protein